VAVIGQILATPLQTAFVLWPEHQVVSPGDALPEIPVAFLFSIVGAVLGSLFTAPLLAVTLTLVQPAMRAKAAAIATATHSLFGHGLGPYLVGEVSAQLTPTHGVYALRYALLVATLMPLVSALFFWLAARTVREDIARLR
jgi:hypothetical protein